MKVPYGDGSGGTGYVEVPAFGSTPNQIRIVKSCDRVDRRKDAVLKNLDHFEAQLGRLAKMARDLRAEVLSLTAE